MDTKQLTGVKSFIREIENRLYITESGSYFRVNNVPHSTDPIWVTDIRWLITSVKMLMNDVENPNESPISNSDLQK